MDKLRFALLSCAYPTGLIDGRLAIRSVEQLWQLPPGSRPEFVIFAGDQIYVDATAGLFDPEVSEYSFESTYRAEATPRRMVLLNKNVELHCMLDDHEIADNWEPESSLANQKLCDAASAAYVSECRNRPKRSNHIGAYTPGDPLWYHFDDESGHRFFLADTRTTRTRRTATMVADAQIICPAQWRDLTAWLSQAPRDRLSFLVCPSIVLPRRLATKREPTAALHSDAWDGYPSSLHALLALLFELDNPNIVLLSGDEHFACVATINLTSASVPERQLTVYSLHTPALYAPYPFANGTPWNFAAKEQFRFEHSVQGDAAVSYECSVDTVFPSADDGYLLIDIAPADSGQIALNARFHASSSGSEGFERRFVI